MSEPGPAPRRAGGIAAAEAVALAGLVDYAPGAVVSRALIQSQPASVTLFAFDAGQGLNEHTTPYDAHVLVLDGVADWTIGGAAVTAKASEILRLPASVPHAVDARERFKMLLIMVRA